MNINKSDKITFAWWNTSLAPTAVTRADDKMRTFVCNVIRYLITNRQVDFLALGEMSQVDAEYITQNLNIDEFDFKDGIISIGRSSFDTFYVYNSQKLFISDVINVVSKHGTSNLRIAQKLDVIVSDFNSLCHVFVSHWPSRLNCHENSPDRQRLGLRLRDEIDSLIERFENPHIILLGDYNDEPFNESLSEQIMATRDFSMALKRPQLLFNPFWKYLGGSLNIADLYGSYHYKSGNITRWHTFDQMIFSHAFLKGKDWILDTKADHIVSVPGHLEAILDNKTIFDHLPIIGSIVRV